MDHSVDVLLIGGPCDSYVVSRPTSDTRFEVVPPRPSTEHIPIVFASEPRPESYFYEIHRLWDGEQPYRVAVWEGHEQSVIETLIEGYKPKWSATKTYRQPLPDTPKGHLRN